MIDHDQRVHARLDGLKMEAPLVRIALETTLCHGLRRPSQRMVDKLFCVPSEVMETVVNELEPQMLVELDMALRGWLELP